MIKHSEEFKREAVGAFDDDAVVVGVTAIGDGRFSLLVLVNRDETAFAGC